jgi:hypothetical protein
MFSKPRHIVTYPVVTTGWDTSGGDNQTTFTSKHFHVDFFFIWNHISKDSFYSTQQTPVFNSSFKPFSFFNNSLQTAKGSVKHFEMGFTLMW